MVTRSKGTSRKKKKNIPPNQDLDDLDDVDGHGNLKGLIDYDCEDEIDFEDLKDTISRFKRGNNITISTVEFDSESDEEYVPVKKKKIQMVVDEEPEDVKTQNPGDLLMGYLVKRANEEMQRREKKRKRMKELKKKLEEDVSEEESEESEDITDEEEYDEEEDLEEEYDEEDLEEEDLEEEDLEEESDAESFLDELDEEFSELTELYSGDNTEDTQIDYFHDLDKKKKKSYIKQMEKIYKIEESNIPLKFKVLDSKMSNETKSIAISNLDKISGMDASNGEYSKMNQWINGLIKIPFNENILLPVDHTKSENRQKKFIKKTSKSLNKAVYGHTEAKTHILQIIGKWIRNPGAGGNVLAIQGPMGNGKTTLIKNGVAKALKRPFTFVALGGASDSSYFDGHCYTYEGARWGRIVDILHQSKCMNPIICFDELDKVSDTAKGDEIINMLIHITDTSQNNTFQDNYFPGVNIDLSKVLFVFSFNDESKINRILKDRMQVIRTKGYEMKDKLEIAKNYLLPEIYSMYNYTDKDVVFTEDCLSYIIQNFTDSESGVRNLKRCLDNLVSLINLYNISKNDKKIVERTIEEFQLPITLTTDIVDKLLKKEKGDKPPEHMYM
jgi:ATP-dependent Lon protease